MMVHYGLEFYQKGGINIRYQDIQISDVSLRNQFVQYWMNGNYQQAFNIINNNPQLDSKAFVAEIINLITQSLLAIEQKYYTNVEDFLVVELNKYQTTINNFIKRGDWNNATPYVVGNFVLHNDDIYLCIKNNTNIPTTNTTYWVFLGLKGLTGENGIDVNLKYQWKANVNYIVKDVVFESEAFYVSKTSNIGKNPKTNPNDWSVFLDVPKAKIATSVNPPIDPYNGLIWLKKI